MTANGLVIAGREAAPEHSEPLTARVAELEAERTRLATMVAILQRVAIAPNVADAMLTVVRELGEAYVLDRSSILLVDQAGGARIVATHEDPSIQSRSIELSRYPEVRRAIASGTTVFLADVTAEPMSWMVRETLRKRNVASAIVVPITQTGKCVGVIFLRTRRDRPQVTGEEIRFFESVAAILAAAFAKARADASAARQQATLTASLRRMDAQRVSLVAFLERLRVQFKDLDGQAESVAALIPAADYELEQTVGLQGRTPGNGATKE